MLTQGASDRSRQARIRSVLICYVVAVIGMDMQRSR